MTVGIPNAYDFTLPFTTDNIDVLRVYFGQGDKIISVKKLTEFDAGSNKITVTLSGEESARFIPGRQADVQIRLVFDDGTPWESEVGHVGVYGGLVNGVV